MKKLLSVLLIVAMMLSMAACGQPAGNDNGGAEGNGAFPVTVTDQAGREVTIEEQPEKLVSGYYISTSLLIALDLDEKMAGVEAKNEKRFLYQVSAPQLTTMPNVGTAKEFDLEGCIALEPDLVILPLKLKGIVESLEKLGIDVLLVNPENAELLTEMVNLVADATGTQDRAQQLLTFIDTQKSALEEVLADVETPSVYLAGNSSMLSTAGDAMYQSDMIRMAGGANAAADLTDTYWVEIDYEQLLTWNPEYIILASDAVYTVEDVLADPNLAGCDAVKKGNVFQIPGNAEAWDSPVPSSILGSVWLASVLHPDLMDKEAGTAVMDEYYETFYGFKYSEN